MSLSKGKKLFLFSTGVSASIFIIFLFLCVYVFYNSEIPQPNIAQEWNRSISRLGIEPVYPPQEDVVVGDIILNVSRAAQGTDLTQNNFLGKSVRIDHIDLTRNIEDSYRTSYRFPDTMARPEGDSFWPQAASEGSVFDPVDKRVRLPLVSFPAFKISASAKFTGLALIANRLASKIGLNADLQRESLLELRIPIAESYGVNAIVATGALMQFCKSTATKVFCSEDFARRQLSMIVGKAIYEPCVDADVKAPPAPCLGVEILLISRVFLIRSIEQSGEATRFIDIDAHDEARMVDSTPAPKDPEKSTDPTVMQDSASRAVLPVPEQTARSTESAVPNIRAKMTARTGQSIGMKQTFQRPLAMGFRAVRFDLCKQE